MFHYVLEDGPPWRWPTTSLKTVHPEDGPPCPWRWSTLKMVLHVREEGTPWRWSTMSPKSYILKMVYHVPDRTREDGLGVADSLRQLCFHAGLLSWSVNATVVAGDRVMFRRPRVTKASCRTSVFYRRRDGQLTAAVEDSTKKSDRHQPPSPPLHRAFFRLLWWKLCTQCRI